MTPEERAKTIIDKHYVDGSAQETLDAIAASIRAAVNDALERAAVMALRSGAHENVAENIRTLKHSTSSEY